MELKKILGKKGKIITLCSLLAVSLISTVSATFSWFSANRTVDESIDTITVTNDPDYTVTHRVLKFDDKTKKGKVISASASGDLTCTLDSFDNFIESRNKYLSQIIEITIKYVGGSSSSANVYVDIPITSNYTDSASSVASYMSNVARIRTCLYSIKMSSGSANPVWTLGNVNRYLQEMDPSSSTTYTDEDDKYYQEVRYHLENTSGKYNPNHYVDETAVKTLADKGLEKDDPTFISDLANINKNKVKNLHLDIPSENGSKYALPAGFTEATFCIQIDYSSILTHFFANNKGASVYSGDAVKVNSDFSLIKIGVTN